MQKRRGRRNVRPRMAAGTTGLVWRLKLQNGRVYCLRSAHNVVAAGEEEHLVRLAHAPEEPHRAGEPRIVVIGEGIVEDHGDALGLRAHTTNHGEAQRKIDLVDGPLAQPALGIGV